MTTLAGVLPVILTLELEWATRTGGAGEHRASGRSLSRGPLRDRALSATPHLRRVGAIAVVVAEASQFLKEGEATFRGLAAIKSGTA